MIPITPDEIANAIGEQHEVTIYCDDGHDRWDVDVLAGGQPNSEWTSINSGDHTAISGVARSHAWLVDDEYVTDSMFGSRAEDAELMRSRSNYRCKYCKNRVPVRSEKLKLILDTLSISGVSEISLAALGARLRRR